jgi:hypothetical protein
MERRIDYEVRSPTGLLLFTSDDPQLAMRWAEARCAPDYSLVVERVERSRHHIANHHPQDAAAS